MNNPYETPKTDLVEENLIPHRSIMWKIYIFIYLGLTYLGCTSYFFDPKAGISEVITIFLLIAFSVGLWGFMFSKKILSARLWQAVLILSLLFSIAYYFLTEINLKEGMSNQTYLISHIIAWLISLPSYIALFIYGFKSRAIWENHS